jgi:hypothetical protein
MNITKIVELVLKESNLQKEAGLLSDIKRVLSLNLDDAMVNQGLKVLNILDKIETSKESTLIEKQDLVSIKDKIRQSMQLFQESIEDLFSLHERLIRESEMSSKE